jgi:hypothetical protein
MDKIIIERANVCELVKTKKIYFEYNSWGKNEWIDQNYVVLFNNENKDVCDSEFIVHDGSNVLDVFSDFKFLTSIRQFLDENYEKELKEKRFNEYEKLRKEFEK